MSTNKTDTSKNQGTALIIVDVQNDFVEGGALGVTGGKELANHLAKILTKRVLIDSFDRIIFTQDWHVDPGNHFSDNPDFVDSWPVHCVAGTHGAELVDPVKKVAGEIENATFVTKGMHDAAYSAFEGVTNHGGLSLEDTLKGMGIGSVTVTGIATDYCVKETALDAAQLGFRTFVWSNMTRGVTPETTKQALEVTLPEAGIIVV